MLAQYNSNNNNINNNNDNSKLIYFRKQDDSVFKIGIVSRVPLSCNEAIFNKITKCSPDNISQSP